MVNIELHDGQTGYNVVGEYIRRYWEHNAFDIVIVFLGTSYDGSNYDLRKEVAVPTGMDNIEFFFDWWEGEKYIKLFGIKSVSEINFIGGIYEE